MPRAMGARSSGRVTHVFARERHAVKMESGESMADRLVGKVALVTGGGGGIGEATARLFHEEGARVMIVDLDGDAARIAADGIDPAGARIGAIAADLTQEAEAERAVVETVARFGRLDVLAEVHAAWDASFADVVAAVTNLTDDDFDPAAPSAPHSSMDTDAARRRLITRSAALTRTRTGPSKGSSSTTATVTWGENPSSPR